MHKNEGAKVHDILALPIQTARRTRKKTVEPWQSELYVKLHEDLDEHESNAGGGKVGRKSQEELEEVTGVGFNGEVGVHQGYESTEHHSQSQVWGQSRAGDLCSPPSVQRVA